MGILGVLINALIFSLPLGVVFRLTPFPNVSIYPYDLIAGLIFLSVLFQIFVRKQKIVERKIFILACLFLLVGFISLVINSQYFSFQNFLVSLAYLIRWGAYAGIIFAFQFLDPKFKESINIKLVIAGSIFVLAGFIQYFYYPNLRNLYYLGWDEHLYRLFSTFLDPNFAGAFLVLFFILIMENIIIGSQKLGQLNRLGLFGLWVAALIAIILTYSRSAFIMLILGTIVLLAFHKFFKQMIVLLVFIFGLFFLFANFKIEGLNPLRVVSTEARIESAREALIIFGKNPILGVGFNAYRYAQVRYGFRDAQGSAISNADAGTDNSYLFVLATTGILGFVIFFDFWLNILMIIFRNIRSDFYTKVALASIAGLLVNTLFINSLFYPPIMAWIFILVGLTVNKR